MIDSPPMSRLAWIGVAPLLGICMSTLCACVSTTSALRTRFAKEQSCPEEQVVVDEEGGTLYRARGCEKETTYACGSVGGFNPGAQCTQEGLPNPPGYREPDRPVVPPPDPRIAPSQ